MEKIDKGIGWLDKTLAIVERYKFKTIFKAVAVILIIAGVIGFIKNPYVLFEFYETWKDKQHTEAMFIREENDAKIHNIIDKLNYRVTSDRVMVMEFHNGTDSNGGMPFRKMTCTYEAINVGVRPIAGNYNEVNLSLIPFVNYMNTKGYWCGNTNDIEEIDRAFCYKLKSDGIEHFACCIIEGVDKPLALLIVAFDNPDDMHNCEDVRENIRHCVIELALLLELNKRTF